MKKKIVFAVLFILIAWSFTACDALLKNCQACKIVTRTSGGTEVSSGDETMYCDTELLRVKTADPIIDQSSGNVTKYECR